MIKTQKIFDELSENVASIENEEKQLRKDLNCYITAGDVIVLDGERGTCIPEHFVLMLESISVTDTKFGSCIKIPSYW